MFNPFTSIDPPWSYQPPTALLGPVDPATIEDHERVITLFVLALTDWSMRGNGGTAFGFGYVDGVSVANLEFFRRGNVPKVCPIRGFVEASPDLIVEITPQKLERAARLRWQADRGVPEQWLVDPENQTLERLVLRGNTYSVEEVVTGDGIFRPPSFEGLVLPMGKAWTTPLPFPTIDDDDGDDVFYVTRLT